MKSFQFFFYDTRINKKIFVEVRFGFTYIKLEALTTKPGLPAERCNIPQCVENSKKLG